MKNENQFNIIHFARNVKSGQVKLTRKNFIKWAFITDVILPLSKFNVHIAVWRLIKFPFVVNKAYNLFKNITQKQII